MLTLFPYSNMLFMKNFLTYAKQLSQELSDTLKNQLPADTARFTYTEASTGIKITLGYISTLRTEMNKYGKGGMLSFTDPEEEILFFKEIKPAFLRHFYFYKTMFRILSSVPTGPAKAVRVFLKKEMNKIHAFAKNNRELYIHYSSGITQLDYLFFRRTDIETKLAMGYGNVSTDDHFSTGFDTRLAKIMANEKLHTFLKSELSNLDNDSDRKPSVMLPQNKLSWTDSKASLVELMYALYYAGAINHGKATLKEIACFFENNFGVTLGDYYRIYVEIRTRKKGYTVFLAAIKSLLDKKIEESFQN